MPYRFLYFDPFCKSELPLPAKTGCICNRFVFQDTLRAGMGQKQGCRQLVLISRQWIGKGWKY